MLSLAAFFIALQVASSGGVEPASKTAAPSPAPAADSDAVFGIFESLCLSGGEAPAGFEPAAWNDFPQALRLMNTYDHDGTFLRRANPATYVARTQGAGHLSPGLEKRCSVAAQGMETAGIVERLRKRAQAEETSNIGAAGTSMTLIAGSGGVFDVTHTEEGWVILRSMEILIPADMVPRRYLKRKRKGN